jgi:predicted Rossmann-fold nucleotide-binding protein
MGEGRNVLVARSGEALVAVGGGWGTLSEVALARKLLLPVAVLGPWEHPEMDLERFQDPDLAANWAVRMAEQARAGGGDPGSHPVV